MLTPHSMTITTRQQSAKKSNNNLNMITKHPPPTPGLLRPSQDDNTNHSNNYIQQLPLSATPFNMHHDLQSSSQPLINFSSNANNTNTNSSAIIWDYLMAQVKVQLRTMPRDESFFSRGLELQSLVRSEVGILSSDHDLLNDGMETMTGSQSQAAASSLGSRGYQQQQQQPLSYAVSSTSFVSISPMRTSVKQSRGNTYTTSQQHLLLPSTENVGVGMMKQHEYHHASSAEDTAPTTSNKMSRATSSHNQVDTSVSFCQCHPLCREISNPYGTKLYLQDSPSEKTEVSSTPLALDKKMSGTCLTNPPIQEQLDFSASKKDTNTAGTTNTSNTSPPGQLYLHAAGLSSATATPLHDKFVFSDMTEIDSTSTGISSPSKQKAGSTTKVASKWSEVPFKAKKKTKVKSSSRTVSSSVNVKAKKKRTNVKSSVSSAARKVSLKPSRKHTTRGSTKASTLTITFPTDTVSVEKAPSAAKKVSLKPPQLQKVTTRGSKKASIDFPTDVDVLCGRGGSFNRHKGNVRFRDYVRQLRTAYQQARKKDKTALSEVSTLLKS